MQIRIEIDVRPEELRRFLGLPDVSGLQDDIIGFLRGKVGAATEFDASQFVKNNLETLRRTPAWQKIAARIRLGEEEMTPPEPTPTKPKRRRAARKAKPAESAPRSHEDGNLGE